MKSEQLAWLIRRDGIEMTHRGQGSHIGSILSVADIISVLYTGYANVAPSLADNPKRDYIILSKGHAGAAIYAALAETGFFDRNLLLTHYQNGSILSGHVSHKNVPGVEISTGSLGHGLSVASGVAYSHKIDNNQDKIFVIMGDGECEEGSVWEAAELSASLKLDNLIVVVDRNRQQGLGDTEKIIKLDNLNQKWNSFGWFVQSIDGNNHEDLKKAISQAKESSGCPCVIIANTIKGKGISFMENNLLWHYRFPHSGGEYEKAVEELRRSRPNGVPDFYGDDKL